MKHIDLVKALQSVFSQPVLGQLSVRFGLSADILKSVIDRAAPALVSALMVAGSMPGAVENLFAALMSAQVNARIDGELAEIASTTAGLKSLEERGQSFVRDAMSVTPWELSDFVASTSGIPTQAAYAMTGVIVATLSGVLKRHILIEQGSSSALPLLLAAQWPSIQSEFSDALASTLHFDSAIEFCDTIPAQLRVLSGNLKRAEETKKAEETKCEEPVDSAVLTRTAPPRIKRKVIAGLLVVAGGASAIACGLYYAQRSQSAVELNNTTSIQKPVPRETTSNTSQKEVTGSAGTSSPMTADVSTTTSVASEAVVAGPVATSSPSPSTSASASGSTALSFASNGAAPDKPHHARFGFGVGRTGVANVYATVTSGSEENRLRQILNRGLGSGHYTADIVVDTKSSADWIAHSEALVPLMRIARSDMTINDRNIELGGAAAQADAHWVPRIRAMFGPRYNVGIFDAAKAVSSSTAAFKTGIENLPTTGNCDSIDRVLNIQVVDFARGSGHIPQSATDNLSETARVLKACAARGQTIALTIESFTDNVGDPKANLDLSAKRAAAVRTFLVERGVAAASLDAKGYGISRPIASNATARGRFANRRIIFVPGTTS
ncbi:OmpA family protein [Paraburkholderia antibiotica]|uniref:OmpA family protein n=1 Tax=Paraburkholderia antibiotica TaxID=2728839 RepID=A0A7X9ZZI7_9BURK|nr:OmpA family protein [Paraburkholderia antibiotica]NML32723.1 OmpA family protein [Paraburkholderia antibiotica]